MRQYAVSARSGPIRCPAKHCNAQQNHSSRTAPKTDAALKEHSTVSADLTNVRVVNAIESKKSSTTATSQKGIRSTELHTWKPFTRRRSRKPGKLPNQRCR
mmetsp:Transcript_142924/g.249354  ORF Transcript_142924/g.249354 Transcript_142924/m.249354 type:complete len:101 (-) Transcript_142924:468-770(-)